MSKDDEKRWAEHLDAERKRIEALIRDGLGDEPYSLLRRRGPSFEHVNLIPPPTWTETVQEAWRMVRDEWSHLAIDGRLVVRCDYGILPDILFEEVRYGGTWVIEADGVVVERIDVR